MVNFMFLAVFGVFLLFLGSNSGVVFSLNGWSKTVFCVCFSVFGWGEFCLCLLVLCLGLSFVWKPVFCL